MATEAEMLPCPVSSRLVEADADKKTKITSANTAERMTIALTANTTTTTTTTTNIFKTTAEF